MVDLAIMFAAPFTMMAQGESAIDTGDTAWILVATALVLFMNIPGLALFYAGLGERQECAFCSDALFCVNSNHDNPLAWFVDIPFPFQQPEWSQTPLISTPSSALWISPC
jgi:hypothetical protein